MSTSKEELYIGKKLIYKNREYVVKDCFDGLLLLDDDSTISAEHSEIIWTGRKNLHKKFYAFRDEVWGELEKLVRMGCGYVGEFPIIIGEIDLPQTDKRSSKIISDTDNLIIYGIVKDENYRLFPEKTSENDINVINNVITVILEGGTTIEVEPDILDLQELSTYVSGGFSAYN